MLDEIKLIKKHLNHSKIAIYTVVAFLFLLGFSVIVISNRINQQEVRITSSEAAGPLCPEYAGGSGPQYGAGCFRSFTIKCNVLDPIKKWFRQEARYYLPGQPQCARKDEWLADPRVQEWIRTNCNCPQPTQPPVPPSPTPIKPFSDVCIETPKCINPKYGRQQTCSFEDINGNTVKGHCSNSLAYPGDEKRNTWCCLADTVVTPPKGSGTTTCYPMPGCSVIGASLCPQGTVCRIQKQLEVCCSTSDSFRGANRGRDMSL